MNDCFHFHGTCVTSDTGVGVGVVFWRFGNGDTSIGAAHDLRK